MFDWNFLIFLWIIVAGIAGGFGFAVGVTIGNKLIK